MNEQIYYENPISWHKDRYLANEAELKRFAATMAMIPPDAKTILDVGTGNGAFLSYLEAQQTPIRLLGMERSRVAAHLALCKTPVIRGSADALTFRKQQFELVMALEVIEHLPNLVFENSLEELQRVASKHIIISVPYKERRVNITCPYCGCHFNPHYHMRSFDETRLEDLFHTFRLVTISKVTTPEYVVMPMVRGVRSLFHKQRFTSKAVCPQCNYTNTSKQSDYKSTKASSNPLSRFIRRTIPLRERVRWAIALYTKLS